MVLKLGKIFSVIPKVAEKIGVETAVKTHEKPVHVDAEKSMTILGSASRSYVMPFIEKARNVIIPAERLVGDGNTFMSPMQFKTELEKQGITYIGTLNEEFKNCGLTTENTLKTFDNLASALRILDCNLPYMVKGGSGTYGINLGKMRFMMGSKEAVIEKLGEGEIGHVYKITVDGKDRAFKVFYDPKRIDVHGTFGEINANVTLNAAKVTDCIDFYAANPYAGWSMVEYLAPESKSLKQGNLTVRDYLSRRGFEYVDDWGPNRGPGGKIWDLGGIEPDCPNFSTFSDFKKLFLDPKTRMVAGRRISRIYNPDERAQAVFYCLENPETSAQAIRTARRMSSDPRITEILSKGLDYEESAGRAAYELNVAPKNDRLELLRKALTKPEARIEAAKMLDYIPEHERAQAFHEAWKYPECRPMIARSVPGMQNHPGHQVMRIMIMEGKDPGAKLAYLSIKEKVSGLTEAEQQIKKSSLVNYFANHGLSFQGNIRSAASLLPKFKDFKILENINPLNFHRQRPVEVAVNAYRGGCPLNEEAIIELKNLGVKRIVSFVGKDKAYPDVISTWEDEEYLANKHGIKFIHLPMDEKFGPSIYDVEKFTSLHKEKDKYPYYFHCRAGQDRAGIMGAINDVESLAMSFDEAYERMLSQNHDFRSYPNLDGLLYKYCLAKGEKPENMHPREVIEKWYDSNYWLKGFTDEYHKKSTIDYVLRVMGIKKV